MSQRDDHWRGVTQGLSQDGPAQVPGDLAARAFDAAMDAARTKEPSLLEALLLLARPATAMAFVAATLLLGVGLTREPPAASASSSTLYEQVVGDTSDGSLARLFELGGGS